jgi:CO/xanthine dehydrogenase FAD-binding subunit
MPGYRRAPSVAVPCPAPAHDVTPSVLRPLTVREALRARAADPAAVVVAGGTAAMISLNEGARPAALIDLSRLVELRAIDRGESVVRIGATVTYTRVIDELAEPLPGLAAAARTIAGRQVRNRATIAGALVVGDPSGDALAALVAADAELELAACDRPPRRVRVEDFITAPGHTVLRADELVVALHVPVAAGPVAYAKAGARNAMARAVCGVAAALDPGRRAAAIAVVGASARPVRARAAEALVASEAPWTAPARLEPAWLTAVGECISAAVGGCADDRGSAEYRAHLAGVLGRRALARAWGSLECAR